MDPWILLDEGGGPREWASECLCDSAEWCVNVAPAATADGDRSVSYGTNRLVSDTPAGHHDAVAYSSYDHQLQRPARNIKRNTRKDFQSE